MRKDWKKGMGRMAAACLAVLVMTSCSAVNNDPGKNLIRQEDEAGRVVNLFSPMEKTEADTVNTARSAADKTIIMAEEKLGGVRFLFIPRDKEGVAKAVILHRQFIIH